MTLIFGIFWLIWNMTHNLIQEMDITCEWLPNCQKILWPFRYIHLSLYWHDDNPLKYLTAGKNTDFKHHVTPALVCSLTPYCLSDGKVWTAFCNAVLLVMPNLSLEPSFSCCDPQWKPGFSYCFKVIKTKQGCGSIVQECPSVALVCVVWSLWPAWDSNCR